ncbi:MAG: hypothetical protein JWR36_1802 [Glaciihabitans sp.]|jgi:pSer/pThr/pTyr-binding forkhead associated (FHA) protein|nr:hypothetical protein [Glaciihabitans sp.]MDQ1569567.1 hypothetical protein [Actinomycetota bacterium]
MTELTLLILRLVFLAVLWAFVFAVVYALRSDLFGQKTRKQVADVAATPFPSSPFPTAPVAQSAPLPVASLPTEPIGRSEPLPESGGTSPARRLVITSGPKEGLEIDLPSEQLAIGRSSESGLVIRDDYTSTHHARLMLWNDGWVVQDLDSTNGTFLDGTRVTLPTPVPLNTPITIGQTSFELRR